MQRYVVGLVFDTVERDLVLLQRKKKPEWQKDRLNGPGGKVEAGETPEQAMAREFAEECCVVTCPEEWTQVCVLGRHAGPDQWEVVFLTARVDMRLVRRPDDPAAEYLVWVNRRLGLFGNDVIPNLRWLFWLATDTTVARPVRVEDTYP